MSLYSAEYHTRDIAVEDYIKGFRDAPRFIEYCKQCHNYNGCWGCPPFDFDTEVILRQYKYAHLLAAKITPTDKELPLDKAQELLRPERIKIEEHLRTLEQRYGGRAFAFVGKCLYCHGEPCARLQNKPCRHHDKVRPSLEAFGFDIVRTSQELFGCEILWGREGKMPEYLVLVSALFHSNPDFFLKA